MVKQNFLDQFSAYSRNFTLNSAIEWISENKKAILTSIIALFLLLILAFRLVASRHRDAENDFIKGEALFTQFQNNILVRPEVAKKELQQLADLMNRYPDLHVKFDGAIAQSLFIAGESQLANPYAENIFKRTKSDQLSRYQDFSNISFLIGKNEYADALEKSKQLSLKLEEGDLEEHQGLYLYNLMRIAILNGQLKNTEDEEKTWLQLQGLLNKSESGSQLKKVLQSGKASVQQYIDGKLISG